MKELIEGGYYRVIANTCNHEFALGDIVRYVGCELDSYHMFEELDRSEFWYVVPKNVEEV